MAARGRPTKFSIALAAEICDRLAGGQSLREICRSEDMPCVSAVKNWLRDKPDFVAQYALAREAQADHFAEEILEIADDGSNDWMERQGRDGEVIPVLDREHVSRSQLRVDARKWLMARMAPKKYGEKTSLEHTGKDGAPLIPVLNVTTGGNQSRPAPKAGSGSSDDGD